MAAVPNRLPTMRAKLAFATRRLHAWWEGYAFEPAAERAALQAMLPLDGSPSGRPVADIVAETIWGPGRLEPGSPVWTMRFAHILALPAKAEAVVFGAGAGAPIRDLEQGTRWKVRGLTHAKGVASGKLSHVSTAMTKIQKGGADGTLSFFQLSRETTPSAFAEFASEFVTPGSKAIFVDYAVVRKGARLSRCFGAPGMGTPKTETDYRDALRNAGFVVDEVGDETRNFMELIAHGWAGWRRSYGAISHIEDGRLRAAMLREMSDQAKLWAERYEAMKSGQLRVLFLKATRR